MRNRRLPGSLSTLGGRMGTMVSTLPILVQWTSSFTTSLPCSPCSLSVTVVHKVHHKSRLHPRPRTCLPLVLQKRVRPQEAWPHSQAMDLASMDESSPTLWRPGSMCAQGPLRKQKPRREPHAPLKLTAMGKMSTLCFRVLPKQPLSPVASQH